MEAKVGRIARRFLAGEISAAEACVRVSGYLTLLPNYLSEADKTFLMGVNSETDDLPVTPEVQVLWDPDVLQHKLASLRRYESRIAPEVGDLCTRLLQTIQQRRTEVKGL